jgi:hypothetical protein
LAERTSHRLQSVQEAEPTDYFRRILSEEIDPGDLRDQTVLRDIAAWVNGEANTMVDQLAAATERYERYVTIWEYFASQITDERLNALIDTLFERHLQTRPVEARMPALMACWRIRNRRHRKSIAGPKRVESMMLRALPVSLPLANDVYYFWASIKYGPFDTSDRADVRRAFVSAVQRQFQTVEGLLQSVALYTDERGLWSLYHLIEPPDQEESPSEIRGLAAWNWLAPVLMAAVPINPAAALGQIARLIGRIDHSIAAAEGKTISTYSIEPDRLRTFFGPHAADALEALMAASSAEDSILADAARQSAPLLSAWATGTEQDT